MRTKLNKIKDISKFSFFLKNTDIYNSNKNYWTDYIVSLNSNFEEWMNNNFENGEFINDGNPLVALKNDNKAIRIIQIERNSFMPKFASWNKKYDFSNVDELVICIQPYAHIYLETEMLIKFFLINKSKRFQQKTNFKYNIELNKRRTSYLIENYRILNLESKLVKPNLSVDERILKRVKEVTKKLEENDSTFINKNIERIYNVSIRKATAISVKFTKKIELNIHTAKKINKDFDSLKTELSKLENEIENSEKNIS